MNNYYSLICTAILLPISFIALMGNNNPPVAVSYQREQVSTQLSSKPSGETKSAEPAEKVEFFCGSTYSARLHKKVPTTIAQKGAEKFMLVQWIRPMGDDWTPQKRCQEFARRMQAANHAGTVNYIISGKMNGQQVICTAAKVDGDCQYLLMTLHPDDKPSQFVSDLQDTLHGQGGIVEQ
jgi:Circadian oscillating protein COP23